MYVKSGISWVQLIQVAFVWSDQTDQTDSRQFFPVRMICLVNSFGLQTEQVFETSGLRNLGVELTTEGGEKGVVSGVWMKCLLEQPRHQTVHGATMA